MIMINNNHPKQLLIKGVSLSISVNSNRLTSKMYRTVTCIVICRSRSKAKAFGRSLSVVAISNSAGDMDVCLL